jgi:hypothetical protein
MKHPRLNSGQMMILTSLALGSAILGTTAIAGLLMVYQLRQTTDFANSAKAVFAADAGIEWGLGQRYHSSTMASALSPMAPTYFMNGNEKMLQIECWGGSGAVVDCTDESAVSVVSRGFGGNVATEDGAKRAFVLFFGGL